MRVVPESSIALRLCIVILLSLLIVACAAPTPSAVEPSPVTQPVGEAMPAEAPPEECTVDEAQFATTLEELVLEPDARYVPRQFVVTGRDAGAIDEVITEAVQELGLPCPDLAFERQLDIPGEEEPVEGSVVNLESYGALMVVYALPEDEQVTDLLRFIRESYGEPGEPVLRETVIADRNYVTTLDRQPIPAQLDASPYEGSPGPFGGPQVPVATTLNAGDFASDAENWIWSHINFPPLAGDVPWTGEEVVVGVFDTYPVSACPGLTCGELELTAGVHNFPLPGGGVKDIRDHGAFVARLIQYTAPASQIHVYRVLNDQGKGMVSSIYQAVDAFLTVPAERRAINMSLGVHWVEDSDIAGGTPGDVDQLELSLSQADQDGTVIAAAAGNDGVDQLQLPASLGFVMAVGASNINDHRACFSNSSNSALQADKLVFAPGGEGGPPPPAAPAAQACQAPVPCTPRSHDSCVISLAPHSSGSNTGYAYWSGTSFSTPLVTGLAARLLEADSSMNTQDIRQRIACGANLNGDVISFTLTFDSCP
jgi:subtilisin family serine protease